MLACLKLFDVPAEELLSGRFANLEANALWEGDDCAVMEAHRMGKDIFSTQKDV